MFSVSSRGNYGKTTAELKKLAQATNSDLDSFGKMGVDALRQATPKDTGETASKWQYRIVRSGRRTSIEWYNTHSPYGTPVAILIQYGHGTGTGGYVQGVDYINPAMRGVFDKIAADITRRLKA